MRNKIILCQCCLAYVARSIFNNNVNWMYLEGPGVCPTPLPRGGGGGVKAIMVVMITMMMMTTGDDDDD